MGWSVGIRGMDKLITPARLERPLGVWLSRPLLLAGLGLALAWASAGQAQQGGLTRQTLQTAQMQQAQPSSQLNQSGLDLPSIEQWEKLTPEERRAQGRLFRERFHQLTPQERSEMKSEIRRRFEQLSPQDRERLANQAREDWRAMPPEERARLREERRAQIERLSPEERKAMREERKRLRERLSPEERKRYFQELPQSRWGGHHHRAGNFKDNTAERRPS